MYKHTQIGYLIIYTTLAVILLYTYIILKAGFILSMVIIMAIIVILVASFSTLTVTINQNQLKIKFGYGIYKKTFNLNEIKEVKKVKNYWYYGWGIRYWPGTWIFNISGFDAVEITLKNNQKYRIGTDEPDILEREILKKKV